jgi:hypothetical protein
MKEIKKYLQEMRDQIDVVNNFSKTFTKFNEFRKSIIIETLKLFNNRTASFRLLSNLVKQSKLSFDQLLISNDPYIHKAGKPLETIDIDQSISTQRLYDISNSALLLPLDGNADVDCGKFWENINQISLKDLNDQGFNPKKTVDRKPISDNIVGRKPVATHKKDKIPSYDRDETLQSILEENEYLKKENENLKKKKNDDKTSKISKKDRIQSWVDEASILFDQSQAIDASKNEIPLDSFTKTKHYKVKRYDSGISSNEIKNRGSSVSSEALKKENERIARNLGISGFK